MSSARRTKLSSASSRPAEPCPALIALTASSSAATAWRACSKIGSRSAVTLFSVAVRASAGLGSTVAASTA
jgi:hypothetical protein